MSEVWIPVFDEKYYVCAMDGMVMGRVFKDTNEDKMFVKTYNFFKTREQAAGVGASITDACFKVFIELLKQSHPDLVAQREAEETARIKSELTAE